MTTLLAIVIPIKDESPERIMATLQSCRSSYPRDCQFIIIDSSCSPYLDDELCVKLLQSSSSSTIYLQVPPNGIYNAFNDSLKYIRSRYVAFMNIGDFYTDSAVDKFIVYINQLDLNLVPFTIFWGDSYNYRSSKTSSIRSALCRSSPTSLSFNDLVFDPPCHQATFCDTRIFTQFQIFFQSKLYPICADRDFFLRALSSSVIFHKLHFPVCSYELGGFSAANPLSMLYEIRGLAYNYLGPLGRLFSLFLLYKHLTKRFLLRHFSKQK